jgi:hypothetical protein
MALRSGRAIRFNESTVRPMGRTATGVRGITLASPTDEVVGMISLDDPNATVLVVSENGYGKRTDIEDYRITNRGGKGVKTINVTEKTGELVAIKDVSNDEDLMIINKSGIVIRIGVDTLRVMGRATQGVRLSTLKENDAIASITKVIREEENSFLKTIEHGLKRIDLIIAQTIARNEKTLSGAEVFELYDTYGFPADLSRIIAEEKMLTVDEIGFDEEMAKQKARSKKSSAQKVYDWVVLEEQNEKNEVNNLQDHSKYNQMWLKRLDKLQIGRAHV